MGLLNFLGLNWMIKVDLTSHALRGLVRHSSINNLISELMLSNMIKSVMTCNIALYAITLPLDTIVFPWICCLLFIAYNDKNA